MRVTSEKRMLDGGLGVAKIRFAMDMSEDVSGVGFRCVVGRYERTLLDISARLHRRAYGWASARMSTATVSVGSAQSR